MTFSNPGEQTDEQLMFVSMESCSSGPDGSGGSEVETLHDGVSVELEAEESLGGEALQVSVEAVLQPARLDPLVVLLQLLAAGAVVVLDLRRVLTSPLVPPQLVLTHSPARLLFVPGLSWDRLGPGESARLGPAVCGFSRSVGEVLVAVRGLASQPADPLPQRPDERDGHEEPVRGQTQLGLGGHVVPVTWKLLDRKPFDVPDLLPGFGVKLGVLGHSRDDVEPHHLVGDLLLDVPVFTDAVFDIEAGLLQHLPHRAVMRSLVLVHLPLRESPAGLGQVALNQQRVLQVFIQDDGSVRGHPHLVLLPLLQHLLHVLPVRQQEGAVLEDRFSEVPDPAVRSSRGVLHAEVQVEPVGQLDLEAHPDRVVPLLAGDVQDEAAAEVVQESGGDLRPLCVHVGRKHPD